MHQTTSCSPATLGLPLPLSQDAWEARLASMAAAWRRRRTGRTASAPSLAGKPAAAATNGNTSAAASHSSGQDEAVSLAQDSLYQPPSSVQLAGRSRFGDSGPLPEPSPRRRAGSSFHASP